MIWRSLTLLLLLTGSGTRGVSLRGTKCQDGGCPDVNADGLNVIQMEVPISNNRTVTLTLQKSDVINASVPIYLGTGRYAISQWAGQKADDFTVYQDPQRQASLVTWEADEETGTAQGMRGIFQDGGHMYHIEPMNAIRDQASPDPAMSPDPSLPQGKSIVANISNVEVLISDISHQAAALDAEQRLTEQTEAIQHTIHDFMYESTNQGHDFAKGYYEVELLLVADYSLFDRWVRASSRRDYRSREAEAIDNIRFYFAHVLHGISQRYESVENSNIQIRIRPVGIYIAKSRSASYWTESAGIKEASSYSEAYKALDAFEEWINIEDVTSKLPVFDQATLYTGNYLFNGWSQGRRRTIGGLADIYGICTDKRASINRDVGVFSSIQTGAHELGHNLGAFHDGYDNSCSSRDQYIMATSPGQINDQNRDNPTKFSYCTRNAFREYLLMLSDRGTNCLVRRDNTDQWDTGNYLTTKPGERYSADEQCMLVYGEQSFYCGGGHRDTEICTIMYCWDPLEGKCKGSPEQRAADRTQCGHQKWCDRSQCVHDSRAPRADHPTCVYGDYRDVVDQQNTCYDIGVNQPYLCYEDSIRSKCCDTCREIERVDRPQCIYGDHNPEYCSNNINHYDCYDSTTRDTCCETCAKFETEIPGCEYGDKHSKCPDIEPYRCYKEGKECCQKCQTPPAGATPGCEWGDKASWCRDLDTRECENDVTRATCCDRCKQSGSTNSEQNCNGPDKSQYCSSSITFAGHCYREEYRCCSTCSGYTTGKPGCVYGDRYDWCKRYVSENSGICDRNAAINDDCCQSCESSSSNNGGPGDNCQDGADWCRDIHPGYCYSAQTERTCCATCKRHERATSHCRYGDEFTWCKKDYCGDYAQHCCDTC